MIGGPLDGSLGRVADVVERNQANESFGVKIALPHKTTTSRYRYPRLKDPMVAKNVAQCEEKISTFLYSHLVSALLIAIVDTTKHTNDNAHHKLLPLVTDGIALLRLLPGQQWKIPNANEDISADLTCAL
jgi:hypothetical protein